MKIQVTSGAAYERKGDLLVLGVFKATDDAGGAKGEDAPAKKTAKKKKAAKKVSAKKGGDEGAWLRSQIAAVDAALDGHLVSTAVAEGYSASLGETFWMHTHGKLNAKRVLLIGLGKADDVAVDSFRRVGGKAVSSANQVKARRVVLALPDVEGLRDEAVIGATAEGALLANYRFDRHLTENNEPPTAAELEIVSETASRTSPKAALERAHAIADGVRLARDLVNECPANLTPEQFAKEAQQAGRQAGLQVKVLGEAELKRERMGLMLAVARAASPYTPPRLVRLHYKPKGKARKRVALVGKGLTFDSGGLDIKPAAGMLDMKVDMGGAAAVLGAMLAIGRLKPDVEVIGYLGCVENGVGGNAYHPGDILKSRKGLTVEVNNTDAEGRLVLADCIDYALTTDKPDILIDLATLTGACMVALGPSTAGLFSDDDELAEDILSAGERGGEDFWRLPLNEDLAGQLKSQVADMRNTGERWGGAITAALFLKRFVDGRAKWAHLDIAGPATMEREHDYTPRGGAGFGVRTIVGVVDPA